MEWVGNMKKAILSIIAVVLTLTLCASSALAAPAWKKDTEVKLPYGIAKKLFKDSDSFESWARKSIEKLMLKGIVKGVDGSFLPRNSVTKIEAVTMALRVMGWEKEAGCITRLPKEYKGRDVQKWAVGYVSLAYEKGILDDVDMMYFNPNEAVKRYEVAKYVIRALGYEEEAQDHMDEELPFVDAAAVPQGAVGYVYLINDMGIMKGDGKRFNPMGSLTRSEMAVLFNNLDEKVDSETDEGEYTGTVYRLSGSRIGIKEGSSSYTYALDEDVVVYQEGDRIDISDIDIGSRVTIEVEDDRVVFIEVIDEKDEDEKIISVYTGKLIEIENGRPVIITLQIQEMKGIFNVLNDAEVYFNGEKGKLLEVQAGDDVKVTVDNRNRVRKIYVYRERLD
jgi:hypothetical protein